jgi:hypothetical protein
MQLAADEAAAREKEDAENRKEEESGWFSFAACMPVACAQK